MSKRRFKAVRYITILVLVSFLLIGLTSLSQEKKEETVKESELVEEVTVIEEMIGHIDWEEGYVYAVGDGVPPKEAVSPAQARVRAKRAAIDSGYARLLEMAKAVRVDAESTTVNYINESRIIRTRVSGLVRNAEIVKLRHFEDGSYQVLMRMPMNGKEGLASAILPAELEKAIRVGIAYEISQEEMVKEEVEETKKSYSGLIIDARGLEVKPAMYPKLITSSKKVIYDIKNANPNIVIQKGLVGYKEDLEKAKNSSRVGDNPLVIEALSVEGEYGADIVLTEKDATKILEVNSATNFLSKAKVVIVI